jgi:type VI protein secretion system component VasF
MKQIQIDLLSETINCPVVQMPGRKYPGVILQGDSLRILLDSADEVQHLCNSVPNPDLSAAIASLREKLADYVAGYEHAMEEAGRELPYSK